MRRGMRGWKRRILGNMPRSMKSRSRGECRGRRGSRRRRWRRTREVIGDRQDK